MANKKSDLRNVLLYTQQLLSLNEKILYDLGTSPYPVFYEHAIVGIEGVALNADDGETWLRIRRIREDQPPTPNEIFEGWAEFGQHPTPDRAPRLVEKRLLKLTPDEISELCEAGSLDMEDVMRPLDADSPNPDRLDVLLRIENMPEFRAMWQEYIDGPWAEWAEVEKPRRRSIDLYNKLYQIHQRILSFGDDNPIELVWGVGMSRWEHPETKISVPLVEQLVEIELEDDGALVVRPRTTTPSVVLKAFHALEVEGSKSLQRDVNEQLKRIVEDPDIGFSPFDKTSYEKILLTCVARLSASAIYIPEIEPENRGLPEFGRDLAITDTWTIYVRQRTEDIRKDDINRLIDKIERTEEDELPKPGGAFVTPPSNKRLYGGDDDIDLTDTGLNLPATAAGGHFSGHGDWGGGDISGGDDDGGSKPMPGVPAPEAHDRNYFFPLPFNEEQIEIARRLEQSDGVVVQGPPGTGKTHTIANIICHYLATGRRVLVTAKTPEALTALQEKLPEGIRDLAIAVIHNDRLGARQLEQAVQVLANQAKQVNTRISTEEIRQKQARLAELQTSIAEIDAELGEIAHKNLSEFPVPVNRQKMMPIDVAKLVARDRNWHTWFPDTLSNGLQAKPRFTDSDVARVREIRQAFGPDLLYKTEDFPDPAALPDLAAVVAAHEELQRITRIEGEAAQGQIPYIAFTDQAGCDDARALLDFLDKVHEAFLHFERYHWLKAVYETLVGERDWEDESWSPLMEELTNWVRLTNRGRALSLKAIDTGEVDVPDAPVDRAIEDLCADKKPFGLFSLGKGGLKNQIERMTIEGRKPASCEDWQMIRDYRIWQREVVSFLGRWRGLSQGLDLMELPLTWTAGSEQMMQVGRAVEVVIAVGQAVPEHRQKAKLLFPYGVDITRALHQGEIDSLRHALKANLEREDLPGAQALKASIEAAIRNPRLPFDAVLRSFVDALGSEGTTPHEVAKAWRDILQESARLEALAPIRNELENLVRKIADSGAPKWAETLLAKVVGEEIDPWTPTDWRKTWFWAQANSYILSISDRARIAKLLGKRSDAEVEQKRLFTEVVQLRTFLAMKQNLTARVEAALGKFATAIARLGRGTGKAAARYRRIIRESTYETAEAVPCWILPEWRVCEQLPSELGTFELVIVDEASQSDITALPAILRGKKLLIVGDDKQVSPSAIGIEERQIIQLRATYLEGLPFADQMDPATSLYELGSIVFPGKAILLREHFRCVEPIIRFSSRFYPQPLIPLRLPTATERLDPPLIDIHVPHGVKDRDINLAEVEVVVAEIRAMTENPDFQNRTIGVISLIGNKQARKCYDRLVQELGAETMERHRIKCGNAATFQGQERDIMVLSMVACPATARAQTSRTFQQRFNVALSRARDRMVLVRSVTSSQLRPNDLKLDVIEHFRSPMGGGNISQSTDILDRCESDFEKDVCQRLLDYGYRIQPQVPVGARRIDVVVEGANDRRLAVELDGDKYHGPERWAEDVNRQRALERMGWIFWRCWGSNWAADPDGCFEELRATLHRLEIEPIGAKAVTDIRTEHRTAEPPTVPELPLEVIAPTADLHVEPYAIPRVEALYEDFADSIVPVEDGEAHEHAVEVDIGDLVVIRYNDAPDKPLRIRLSDRENRPDEGIVHIDEPLGKVLLGAGVDDEIELKIDGLTRIAVVEHIESHSAQAA